MLLKEPIRSVALQGLFTPFLGEASVEEPQYLYTPHDFQGMKALKLNSVLIPLHFDTLLSTADTVKEIVNMASGADLNVILDFKPNGAADTNEAIMATAAFSV